LPSAVTPDSARCAAVSGRAAGRASVAFPKLLGAALDAGSGMLARFRFRHRAALRCDPRGVNVCLLRNFDFGSTVEPAQDRGCSDPREAEHAGPDRRDAKREREPNTASPFFPACPKSGRRKRERSPISAGAAVRPPPSASLAI
jgi:hypothetical protein